MCFGDGGGDGQAEAGSAWLICPVRVEALEGLEQPLDLPGGYWGPCVGHAQERLPVPCSCRDLDLAGGDVAAVEGAVSMNWLWARARPGSPSRASGLAATLGLVPVGNGPGVLAL